MPWWLAHLVGDYLIQGDWMASGKKMSSLICWIHVASYMLPFLLCELSVLQFAFIAIEHFLQDRWNGIRWLMRHTDHEVFATGTLSPWSIVVTDNVLHLVCIWFAVTYL